MACNLFGAKLLPEPMLYYCQLDPEELQSNCGWNPNILIQENAIEKAVWKMSAFCLGLNVLTSMGANARYMLLIPIT